MPGDEEKYPLQMYRKALWFGPLAAPGIH
jgi:hypothetical protein